MSRQRQYEANTVRVSLSPWERAFLGLRQDVEQPLQQATDTTVAKFVMLVRSAKGYFIEFDPFGLTWCRLDNLEAKLLDFAERLDGWRDHPRV